MGLEHLGVVVGNGVDELSRVHRAALTRQQFQSPTTEPYCVLFEDFTHVKFYRHSLYDACVLEGAPFNNSSTSTTGSHSGSSPPQDRTRCRDERSGHPGLEPARP
jgi:hypothetical protein